MSATPSATHLRLDGVSFSYPGRRVLTDVSFTLAGGERLGVIGENGVGKSTLLQLIGGALAPDGGSIEATAPGGVTPRIGLLHQEPPFTPETSLGQALEQAVAPLRAVAAAVDTHAQAMAVSSEAMLGAAASAYAAALGAAEHHQVWSLDARMAAMLDGLGLSDIPPDRPTGALSGGQCARLSLAWLLLSAPDVLLLDEPTNHLDDDATAHLRAVLTGWRGPVLIASHDRAFLDEAVTSLIDLDPAPAAHRHTAPLVGDGPGSGIGLTRFTGNYTDYLGRRRTVRARWQRQYEQEQANLRRLDASIREAREVGHPGTAPRTEARASKKFYADRNATVVARRVNDARSRRDDLAERQIRRPPAELSFSMLASGRPPGRLHGPVITASGVAVQHRLLPVDLAVSAGEQWLITGANGSGKSTLLHLLAGRVQPCRGTLATAPQARIGLLPQEVDLPDPAGRGPERSAAQAYRDILGERMAEATDLAEFGLLGGRDINRPVAALSVGQRRRLALATLLARPPQILLLDEPTNHLSLLLASELEAALLAYPGTVVLASHDRWLRARWTGRTLHLASPHPQ